MPIELKQHARASAPARPGLGESFRRLGRARGGSVDERERLLFTERLALLLETGVSLNAALSTLQAQTESDAMAKVVGALLQDISEGRPFSAALAAQPGVFSRTYVNLIAAGEQGGFMHQMLYELLEAEEKRERLRATLVSALTYPAFLILFSIAVVIFVLVVVFPKFAQMFSSIADQLPATTVALMWVSEALQQHWLLLCAALAASVLGLRAWAATPRGVESLDRLKLALPWVREFYLWLYLIQSLRVMGLSLNNGVGIIDALGACREVVNNVVYRRFIHAVELKIQEGGGIASGFAQASFVPAMVQQMISTGEQTGNLPKVMVRVADFYERELSKRATALAKTVEPVMLLVMGVVVGLLVASLILPIFKLSRAVY